MCTFPVHIFTQAVSLFNKSKTVQTLADFPPKAVNAVLLQVLTPLTQQPSCPGANFSTARFYIFGLKWNRLLALSIVTLAFSRTQQKHLLITVKRLW